MAVVLMLKQGIWHSETGTDAASGAQQFLARPLLRQKLSARDAMAARLISIGHWQAHARGGIFAQQVLNAHGLCPQSLSPLQPLLPLRPSSLATHPKSAPRTPPVPLPMADPLSPALSPLPPPPPPPPRPSRKGKERETDSAPAPTDLAARMIAFQRRNATATKPRDRSERPAPPPKDVPERAQAPPPQTSTIGARSPVLSVQQQPQPRRHPSSPHLAALSSSDADDFSRRLKIGATSAAAVDPYALSSRKHPHPDSARKLYNPHADPPIPTRHTAEPEAISDGTSSSYAPRHPPHPQHPRSPKQPDLGRPSAPRPLFDPRKDDPVRFAVLARPGGKPPAPTPKSSGDWLSASSTSSYTPSLASSSFTLSSGTTASSSANSALFDSSAGGGGGGGGGSRPPRTDESGGSSTTNAFSAQLKRLYREITALEAQVRADDAAEVDVARVIVKKDPQAEAEKWKKASAAHKRLADMMHNLLEVSLDPSVPASLRNIPVKYNIINRLWSIAFHKHLENLRRAAFTQPTDPVAFELLQEFIYYAYTFYTYLVEERTLETFKSNWLECLGDLARYRMAVAAMAGAVALPTGGGATLAAIHRAAADLASPAPSTIKSPIPSVSQQKEVGRSAAAAAEKEEGSLRSAQPAARIDDSPVPSIGLAAARAMELEPEKERWRTIAREWFSKGVAATPGAGKLHHHLGLLSRDTEGEELRAVYHFVKSMIALHPFPTSRESVLPVWSVANQTRRQAPDARVPELFVLLHGMLFTNVQLDDFGPTLARFMERLEVDGAEEREWIMMAVVNVGAVLEYGKPQGLVRRAVANASGSAGTVVLGGGGVNGLAPSVARMRIAPRKEDEMDVDGEAAPVRVQSSPTMEEAAADEEEREELPLALRLALQLTFGMFAYVLGRPTRKPSPYARSTLNPYLTVLLTFLATVARDAAALAIFERGVPWEALAAFLGTAPRGVFADGKVEGAAMLSSGASPLDEDWSLRGMEWVGRRLYERGFWKGGEERHMELEVLEKSEAGVEAVTDGIIEDDEEGEGGARERGASAGRWVRVARAGAALSKVVDGFVWAPGTREWRVETPLTEKIGRWKEEERREREEEERRRRGTRWGDDSMEVDEDGQVDDDEDEEDENDSDEVKALKARRRYLQSLLQEGRREPTMSRSSTRSSLKNATATGPSLKIVAGYTALVIDTNILLSSLSMFASLVESLMWTVVVPLPVVMELEGLSSNQSKLGEAASAAMAYITSHIRTHALSLKIQTSKGNYLPNINVRTEEVDFTDEASWERSMDDLILRAAVWQDEHWVDRSDLLKVHGTPDKTGAAKVVLLSFDRNLRLKARSRQLAAANERDLAAVLASAT